MNTTQKFLTEEKENFGGSTKDGTKPKTTRGFLNTPASDDQWPKCAEGMKFTVKGNDQNL